jgi:DNA-binding transcriptional LysR family regulator
VIHTRAPRTSVRKLERRIGAALFERTSRRVALAPIGRRLEEDLRCCGRAFPDYTDEGLVPRRTPAGRPIERGPEFGTVQEMLSLIGAGQGMFPVPEHAAGFDTRPDIAYIPIRDGLPRERRFIWRSTAETHRIRAFTQVAREVVARCPNPLQA